MNEEEKEKKNIFVTWEMEMIGKWDCMHVFVK